MENLKEMMVTQADHMKGDDLHSMTRSRLERASFIHAVAAGFPVPIAGPTPSHQGKRLPQGIEAGQPMPDKAGLPSAEHQSGTHHDGDYLQSGSFERRHVTGTPYSDYGWVPTSHGDPLVQELSREPSLR